MSTLTAVIAAGLLCTACTSQDNQSSSIWLANAQDGARAHEYTPAPKYMSRSQTGAYLSSRVARLQNDWDAASHYFDNVVDYNQGNAFYYQAMIMAMNAGRYDESIGYAEDLITNGDDNALTYIIAAMGALRADDYQEASRLLKITPDGPLSELLKMPMAAWVYTNTADQDALMALDFTKSFVAYQAILAADQRSQIGNLKTILRKAETLSELPPMLQRNLSAVLKRRDLSYKDELTAATQQAPSREIYNARDGVSWIYYDLAAPLYMQYQDETGRLLFQMSLALTPDFDEANIRLAEYAAGHKRIDEAVDFLASISSESPHYEFVQMLIAELLVENGQVDEALSILEHMAEVKQDMALYVQIAGIYVKNDELSKGLKSYTKALDVAEQHENQNHWQIFFARGRTYDALGRWSAAEKDLLKALEQEPSQPYLLNYIGYSWADRGVNLDKALDMIEQAAQLKPNDGAIRDSLGWVYYRLGHYNKAAKHLERAATLMPYDPVVNDHLGDAYWKVGRRAEAEFQWKRALNHAEDDDMLRGAIEDKLSRY